MKRFRLMGVALFALLAFGVLTAASVSAAPTFSLAQWLVNGAAATTELASTTTGELLLEDTALKADVLCSGSFDGWVGPSSLDFISEVLSLGGVASGTPLVGTAIECESQTTCASSPAPLVWPVNLPWETEVELMEDEGKTYFVDLLTAQNGGGVGYELECTVLGVKSSDECTASPAVSELLLEEATLLERFSDAFTELAGAKLGHCTFAGGETGIIEGEGVVALNGGGELDASIPTVPPTFSLAEWLVNGAVMATELATTTTGELLLEDTALKADVLCSGSFDGWVGPNSLDFISEVLSLGGVASGTPLVGSAIECEAQSACAGSPVPLVWPVDLPWETEVELMEDEGKTYFVDLLTGQNGGNDGYELECTVLGVKSTDECTASPAVSELLLEEATLLEKLSDAFTELAEAKLGHCTFAGGETGIIEGEGIVALNGGGELDASSVPTGSRTFLLAEWLVGGAAVTAELSNTLTGEVLLEDTALKADVLCSGSFDGWVGPNSLTFISEVLSLAGVVSGTPLTGTAITCEAQSTCAASPAPVIWPVNLPWEMEAELLEDEGLIYFVDLLTAQNGGEVGYELECTVLGVKSSDECKATPGVVEVTLDAGVQLLGNFSDAFTELAGAKLGKCTFAGGETGIVEGGGIFALNGGGELTAASEGVVS